MGNTRRHRRADRYSVTITPVHCSRVSQDAVGAPCRPDGGTTEPWGLRSRSSNPQTPTPQANLFEDSRVLKTTGDTVDPSGVLSGRESCVGVGKPPYDTPTWKGRKGRTGGKWTGPEEGYTLQEGRQRGGRGARSAGVRGDVGTVGEGRGMEASLLHSEVRSPPRACDLV